MNESETQRLIDAISAELDKVQEILDRDRDPFPEVIEEEVEDDIHS